MLYVRMDLSGEKHRPGGTSEETEHITKKGVLAGKRLLLVVPPFVFSRGKLSPKAPENVGIFAKRSEKRK